MSAKQSDDCFICGRSERCSGRGTPCDVSLAFPRGAVVESVSYGRGGRVPVIPPFVFDDRVAMLEAQERRLARR